MRENDAAIRAGAAAYDGTPVNEATELRQYRFIVSFGFLSIIVTTPHLLPSPSNRHLKWTGLRYSLLACLFGPWSFPFGPPLTLWAVCTNLCGGRRTTAANVLALARWGWKAPPGVSAGGHRHDVITLSDAAWAAIQERRFAAGQPDDVAIRIQPSRWADRACDIEFDYPVSDGRDWVGESRGVTLLVDKRDSELMQGSVLDYADGRFELTTQVQAKVRLP